MILAARDRTAHVAMRLERALQRGLVGIVYQPEVDLLQGRVTALEVLCTWLDDELGQVLPAEFISIAENRGLIIPLGQYVLGRVLADLPLLLARWPDARIAINLSGVELNQPDFADRFIAALTALEEPVARHLELELTESAFQIDIPRGVHQLQRLREQGLTIAMDDFGTGNSSLSRLYQLPFDKIKLDRSFVQALDHPMTQSIIRSIAQMASEYGRSLVVEGIETPAQLQRLIELGCSLGQGYLLCRPLPPDKLPNALTWPPLPGV